MGTLPSDRIYLHYWKTPDRNKKSQGSYFILGPLIRFSLTWERKQGSEWSDRSSLGSGARLACPG